MKSKQIVITRPAHQAQALVAGIRNMGHRPVVIPALKIVAPLKGFPVEYLCSQAIQESVWIFISPNSVLGLSAALNKQALAAMTKRLRAKETPAILAMGPGTAKALEKLSMPRVVFPSGPRYQSEDLLNLPALKQVAGKRIALFLGEGGLQKIEQHLVEAGAEVKRMVTYRRGCPEHLGTLLSRLDYQATDLFMATSQTSLSNLYKHTPDSDKSVLISKPLLVVSERLYRVACTQGFSRVIVSPNATDLSVLSTLKELYGR